MIPCIWHVWWKVVAWLKQDSPVWRSDRSILIVWSGSVRGFCHVQKHTNFELWTIFIAVSEVPVRPDTPPQNSKILCTNLPWRAREGATLRAAQVVFFIEVAPQELGVWDVAPLKHSSHHPFKKRSWKVFARSTGHIQIQSILLASAVNFHVILLTHL